MADTSYGVNHPAAVQYWHRRLFREALKQTWFSKFIGSDSNSMIQHVDETKKGPGDTIYVILRTLLSGDGVAGDGTLVGNEEELAVNRKSVIIDQLRHAVRSGGKMSEQRVPFSVREEAYMGLRDWWTERLDIWFINQLCGNTTQSDTKYTGMQATAAPSTNNHLFVGGTAEASLTTSASSAFTLTAVDRAVVRAKTKASVPIRPIMVNGEEKYVMFIHPFQHAQLRQNTGTGQYIDIQKAAMTGGQVKDNPLYTGAIGEWNGVVLHENDRMPWSTANSGKRAKTEIGVANVARAVLCGAQAGILATGQNTALGQPNWYEELFDYGNKLGVAAGMIGGFVKTQFTVSGTLEDFGTIVVSTFSADPS